MKDIVLCARVHAAWLDDLDTRDTTHPQHATPWRHGGCTM